mmetsp:Transcript_40390/g.45076  ORF Transcript_40390/g.45076 Transcript_40390/m.45076 type:complete len:113 (-) Transcript_40390:389-727(-)
MAGGPGVSNHSPTTLVFPADGGFVGGFVRTDSAEGLHDAGLWTTGASVGVGAFVGTMILDVGEFVGFVGGFVRGGFVAAGVGGAVTVDVVGAFVGGVGVDGWSTEGLHEAGL